MFLFYAFCELLPKMLFRMFPEPPVPSVARPFRFMHLVLSPLVWLMTKLSRGLLRWTGGKMFTGHLFGSREEMRLFMQESAQGLTSEERLMINRVLDLQNITVRNVTIPMDQVATVTTQTPMGEALKVSQERNLSRLPVWRTEERTAADCGHCEFAGGVVSARNWISTKPAGDYVKPALYLEEEMRLEAALKRMQRSGQRLAIVLGRDQREIGHREFAGHFEGHFRGGEVVDRIGYALHVQIWLKLLGVLALVLLNGFFVAAELALVRIRDTQIETLALKGQSARENRAAADQEPRRHHQRDPIRHHAGEPGPGRAGRTGVRGIAGAGVQLVAGGIASGAAYGGDSDGLFRQLLFADRGRRTGAQGDCHPEDAAGGVVDGAAAGLVCAADVSVRLAAEPLGAMAVAADSASRPPSEAERAHSEEELRL